MEQRGFGAIADLLAFALLVSVAIVLLMTVSPTDLKVESARYASSFARSALLSLQHCTAEQLGGFEYSLGAFGLGIPMIGGLTKRQLSHKTVAQLLAEDALLNMRVEAAGINLALLRPSQEMHDKLNRFLKSCLDNIFGGRFGYRLLVRAEPIDLGLARVKFETGIEDMSRAINQLCMETLLLSLPASGEELAQNVGERLGLDLSGHLKADPILEVSLELWSK